MAHGFADPRTHADVDGEAPIGGEGKTVQMDETFIGGRFARGHRGGDPAEGKTIVFGMLETGGNVVTHVVPNRLRSTIYPLVSASVQPGTQVHTDEYRTYKAIATLGYTHEAVNHRAGEYVCAKTGATVNAIENFWRHLKVSIGSTHVSVSPKYLGRYAKEFEYRFNRRNDPAGMLPELLSTFRPLTAKRG